MMFFAAVASSAQTLPSLLVPSDAAGLGTASANVAATPTAYQVENNVAGMSFSPSRFSAGVSYGMWQPMLPTKSSVQVRCGAVKRDWL